MSACLEEALVQSSDEKRLELLSRAHRLRAAFPTWPMLSWRAIEELVTEEVATVTQLKAGRSTQTLAALADAQLVRSSLLSLALWMLASGVPIPWVSAQHLQQHVAALCVVPWSQPTEGLAHLMLPALRAVLDSPAKAPTNPHVTSSKDKRTSLIGSLFVPIIIEFGNELEKQNLLAQRSILDILMVTFFKQNLRVVELAAMGSLQAVAGYVSRADCAENRLLAISVIQTAVERADKGSLARVVPTIFCTIGSLLVKEYDDEHGDSSIIEQSRALLNDMVKTFGESGLFLQAFKMIAKEDSAQDTTSRTHLVDLALVDLSDVLKRGRQTVEQVLLSLCRFSHGLSWDISEEAAQGFGAFLGRLAKHVAEWDATELNPNPIISTCAALLRLAPPTASQTLLHQTSTLLHLCLSRFEVKSESATELLNASDHVFKQLAAENTVRTVMFELAGSALSGLAVAPETLDTLLSFLAESAVPFRGSTRESVHPQVMAVESARGCLNILLRAHPTIAVLAGPDSTISILESAASVLLKADMTQPGILAQTLSVMSAEASSVQLGVFTYLLLASLGITMGDDARGRLLAMYPILARDSSLCLRAAADLLAVQDAAGSGAEMLSVVFVVIRLSLLAATEPSSVEERETSHRDEVEAMWNRIWPDWYRLISISLDPSCVNAPLRAVAHSVFLDLVIFLSSSRSHLLVIHAGTISHAVQMLVHYTETTNGQGTGKLIKAVSALEGDERLESSSRADLSATGLAAIRGDLLATERLRALRRTQG
ncbi:hypothetical protein JCM24511_08376 [Saitozyma sp. JCM 24511]|nr:hypothetical protein JCM24511_08376 [Saitozyma sp. JCM 24511]